jgi:RNA polymerase sigma factor (sigma-70 family)
MATSPMSKVLQHLRTTVFLLDGAGRSDGELLECFITERDDAAFAALVRRHGPMVWGVCRRILSSHHDAEDAFQITFLVLVRKATSVVPREKLANWLYGVAHQTARNTRAAAARRRLRERQVVEMPEPAAPDQDLWRDLKAVLDQELSRLPSKYRAAIVLCDLEGKTRRDVARQLGVPEGTLSGRLTRGRALLAKRLARHGVAAPGGAFAAVLPHNELSAGVPTSVLSNTIHAAGLLAAGQIPAASIISAQVAALIEGTVRTMLLTKLKIASAVLLIGSLGIGATGLIYCVHAAEGTEQLILSAQAPADREPGGNGAPKSKLTRLAAGPHQKESKFTLGKETTYLTEPLDHEGFVDYETGLNEKLSKEITPENNANVFLWQALRPEPKRTPMPPEFFHWLKVPAPPERGEYFVDLAPYANEALNPGESMDELRKQRSWAAQRPWVEKDYPLIARWLKINAKPLARVIEATQRRDYYNPLVSRKSGDEGWYGLIGALLPGVVKCSREVAPALAAQAMLHAGEGRFEDAWQELLACQRLGRLIGRGADHDEFLLGVSIEQVATDAALALLNRAGPTGPQVRAWLRDLQSLPPIASVADKVDLGVRMTFLNTVMLTRRSPIKTLRLIEILQGPPRQQPGIADPEPQPALVAALDWDALLRTGNVWYDRAAAALRVRDRAAREKAFGQIEAELRALKKDAESPAAVIEALRRAGNLDEVSKQLGAVLIDYFVRDIRRMMRAADQAEQVRRNLGLAFALAVYHCDHGRYAEKLDALAPKYLEEVPGDLFSGKSVIYCPSENEYLLYSVGVNGLDEAGHGFADTPPGDDLCVRMPLPESKRK